MNLCIDIGNTRMKWALIDEGQIIQKGFFPASEGWTGLHNLIEQGKMRVSYAGIVNVSGWEPPQLPASLVRPEQVLQIQAHCSLPFRIQYATPGTLGADRIAAIAGALKVCGKGPLLVFDAGTALTWDFLDAELNYPGGGISPGLSLRIQALHNYTARLPLISAPAVRPPLSGNDTEAAIASGAFNGILAEIDGIAQAYRDSTATDLKVLLTGGDTQVLANHIKNLNFADPDLVFKGIDHILHFNPHP